MEVGRDLAAGFKDSVEDRGGHAQSGLRVSPGNQIAHQLHGLEDDSLAGTSHMREHAVFDIPFLFQEHTTVSRVIEPSDVLPVSQVVEPVVGKDLLTEVLRNGTRGLLARAVEQEVQEWLSERSGLLDERGRKLVVRNGHLPERTILTGIGPVAVRQLESTFATIRLRHRRTKGNGTRKATLMMLFKLAESASHHGRTLDAAMHLIEVAKDNKFQDGCPF